MLTDNKDLCLILNDGDGGTTCTAGNYNATEGETITLSLGAIVEVETVRLRFQDNASAQIADLKIFYG